MSGIDVNGNLQLLDYDQANALSIDTKNPAITAQSVNSTLLADSDAGDDFIVELTFDEAVSADPFISFSDDVASSLSFTGGTWNGNVYSAAYDLTDAGVEIDNIGIAAAQAQDGAGNMQTTFIWDDAFAIDTRNPELVLLAAQTDIVTPAYVGDNGFWIVTSYDEPMDPNTLPVLSFPVENPTALETGTASEWMSAVSYKSTFDVVGPLSDLSDIDVAVTNSRDMAGNLLSTVTNTDVFSISLGISVNEFDAAHKMLIYPNPALPGQDVFIEWKNMPNGLSVDVYNSVGQLVQTKGSASASQNRIQLNTSDFSSGMYFVHVSSDDGRAVFNLTIAK